MIGRYHVLLALGGRHNIICLEIMVEMSSGLCDLEVVIFDSRSCIPSREIDSLGIFLCGLSFRFDNLEYPSCVNTLLNWLTKASAFCLSSLIMFLAMLRSQYTGYLA